MIKKDIDNINDRLEKLNKNVHKIQSHLNAKYPVLNVVWSIGGLIVVVTTIGTLILTLVKTLKRNH